MDKTFIAATAMVALLAGGPAFAGSVGDLAQATTPSTQADQTGQRKGDPGTKIPPKTSTGGAVQSLGGSTTSTPSAQRPSTMQPSAQQPSGQLPSTQADRTGQREGDPGTRIPPETTTGGAVQSLGGSTTPSAAPMGAAGTTTMGTTTMGTTTMGRPWTASSVIGTDVVNTAGNTIGEVDDLEVHPDNRVVAIISVGGFLGIGDRKVAVPMDQLRMGPQNAFVYNATKEQLESMPVYRPVSVN